MDDPNGTNELSGMVRSSMKERLLTQFDWSMVGMMVGRGRMRTRSVVGVGMMMRVGSIKGA